MAATIAVTCPTCSTQTTLRYDPGPDDEHPALAEQEMQQECPDHTATSWRFLNQQPDGK